MFFAGARGRSGIEFGSRRGRAVGTTVAIFLALAGAAILPRLPADWYLKVLVPGWMPHQLVKLIEYSNDLQIALVADRPTEPHARIALVLIRDETIADLPYVSPIDRKRLTDITEAVDRLGARVIGLDLLLGIAALDLLAGDVRLVGRGGRTGAEQGREGQAGDDGGGFT